MKKLLFILAISISFFSSCVENPEENPDAPTPPFESYFRANYDEAVFNANTTQAIVTDTYISLSATNPDGEIFQLTLPVAEEGTYNWSDFNPSAGGFVMMYSEGSGEVPFLGSPDSVGTFANFPSYVDNAQIRITHIDRINQTITGSFQFTGVRFADLTGTTIETVAVSNGSFSLHYLTQVPTGPANNTFTAKLDALDYVPSSILAVSSSGRITISALRTGSETIGLTLISTITPGTYDLDLTGDYVGQYNTNGLTASDIFAADGGSVTITSHDPDTKHIVGTFQFTATSLIPPISSHQITEGTFDITYL